MKQEIGSFALMAGIALTGCTGTAGFATSQGAVLVGEGKNDQWYVNHEQCHVERIQEMGDVEFWTKYLTNPNFACEEEVRCGASREDLIVCR